MGVTLDPTPVGRPSTPCSNKGSSRKFIIRGKKTNRYSYSYHQNSGPCTEASRRGTVWSSYCPFIRVLLVTHSPSGRGLRGPSKFFRDLSLQVWFSGDTRRIRVPKNAHSNTKNWSSCGEHVLSCSSRRILGAPIFKMGKYWLLSTHYRRVDSGDHPGGEQSRTHELVDVVLIRRSRCLMYWVVLSPHVPFLCDNQQ